MRAFWFSALSVVLLAGAASSVSAGPADLDRTFGNHGAVIVSFAEFASVAQAVALQPDGKIVAAGAAGPDFALARLHPDGSLDTSFGIGGRVVSEFASWSEGVDAMVLQPDGKIVVAGTTLSPPSALALARYQPDGTLDPEFGMAGVARMAGLNVRTLALQPDGMLVVGGPSASDFTLVRYDASGALDPTFGIGGVAATDFPRTSDSSVRLYSIALQPDGKIVAVGGGGPLIALARFTANGALDATFGAGGRVTTDLTAVVPLPAGFSFPFSRAYRVRVLGDGKLVLAAVDETDTDSGIYGVPYPPGTALVLRYNGDGTLDTTFNSGGIVILNDRTQQLADARGLVVQPDGGLVAIGWGYFRRRIGSDGTIDQSFASPDTPSGGAIDLTAQSDGRLVAVGYTVNGPEPTFEIVRFGGNCGNGFVDPGEECDDGNDVDGDGCDGNCTVPRCGNGIVTTGEDCEPGASSACCTGSCTFMPAGTPCVLYGGWVCGTPQCNASGACVDALVPTPMCIGAPAGASVLSLSKLSDTHDRRVFWTWKRGPVDAADFEDPLTSPYALCVYDHSGGVSRLAATVPMGNHGCPACWRWTGEGYRYQQRIPRSGSMSVVLRANRAGTGTLRVNATAEFVEPNSVLPMSAEPNVTAQLRNSAGSCWGADYMTASRNDGARFTAKSK